MASKVFRANSHAYTIMEIRLVRIRWAGTIIDTKLLPNELAQDITFSLRQAGVGGGMAVVVLWAGQQALALSVVAEVVGWAF